MGLILLVVVVIANIIVFQAMRNIRFVCWFSARFWDIHDYLTITGGDGCPSHFYEYHCWRCGKKFTI